MFYIKENDKIVLYETDRQKLVDTLKFMPQYAELEILETSDNEVISDFLLMSKEQSETEALNKAKQDKFKEALEKAYNAEENGVVYFKNALFETSTSNTSKLTAQYAMVQAGIIESIQWLSKDDKQVELSGEDIIHLGRIIAEYTGALWNVHYLAYKTQIESASTINEVNAICINYNADIENQE